MREDTGSPSSAAASAARTVEAWRTLPGRFGVRAALRPRRSALRSPRAEFGSPPRTRVVRRAAGDDDVDIVDICTPPAPHVALISAALAAGKHVVCEKPLAGSLPRPTGSRRRAAARGQLMPIFQYRFGNGLQKLNAS